ncbi:hypothetical protein [Brevundimonas sp. G8]|uniref:hypothetical protein n=1 Tax=Brevundimonas sp. G8 TaxID=1350776 RepID=UPI0012F0C2F8|nr:hypothetical protein [Brevundimonas sp. G8]VXB53902.1 conserved hypothetical protein [Brevundimonas sp. G8]
MTTLIAWWSRDQDRFAALHVATDSRISWGSSSRRWDAGRKVFASTTTPDIWAYCGDVVFPALVLSQLTSAADKGALFSAEATVAERHEIVVEGLKSSFQLRHDAPDENFTVVHASRDGERAEARPLLWRTSFNKDGKTWTDEAVEIDEAAPGVITIAGSGSKSLKAEALRWKESYIGGTSRSIYSAFCEAISSGSDPLSGGAPQMASLYPKGGGRTVGAFHQGKPYLHGLPLAQAANPDGFEWFDELFQRVDPRTGAVRPGAARHAKPKRV